MCCAYCTVCSRFNCVRICSSTTIESLSNALQSDSISVDGVVRKLSPTKERLDSISTTVAACIVQDAEFLGESLVYASEHLYRYLMD